MSVVDDLAAFMARLESRTDRPGPDWSDRLCDRIEQDARDRIVSEAPLIHAIQCVRLMVRTTQPSYRYADGVKGKRELVPGESWRVGDLGQDWLVDEVVDYCRDFERWSETATKTPAPGPEHPYSRILNRADREMTRRASGGGPAKPAIVEVLDGF